MRVVLPGLAERCPPAMPRGEQRDGDAIVVVRDAVNGHAIDFDRVVDVPAGRVQPGDEYAAWQKFIRDADGLISRDVRLGR